MATLQDIPSGEALATSRPKINSNFAALNTELGQKETPTGAQAKADVAQAYAIQRANHTGSQAPTTVTQDATHRFTTDAEKATWNALVSFPGFGTTGTTAAVGNDARLSDARTPLAHNQAWSTITSTPTTLSGYGITDAQGLDADLTALAGLSTTGLVARTGAGTAATRTITGTTNQVIVSNGDGVAGNPSLSLPQSIATTSTPQFAQIGLGAAADDTYLLNLNGALVHGTSTGVGICTTSPAARLDLGASTGVVQYIYNDGFSNAGLGINLSGGAGELSLFSGGTGDDAGRISFGRRRMDTGVYTERMAIDAVSGVVKLNSYGAGTLLTDSSGNVTASSDASLKTVTGSFTRGLADVLKLTPRTYHWNEKSGMNTEDENVGFIAQEVLTAVPEAVGRFKTMEVEGREGKKSKKREAAETLTLSDRPLIAALVNAVKELKAENDALSARIAKLEGKK